MFVSAFERFVPYINTRHPFKGEAHDQAQNVICTMVADARARIEEIETTDLISMLEDPNVVVVDIRDARERQRGGFIPGSFHALRGMIEFWIDPDSPYFKDIFAQEDKKFVFHCASGWRSAITTATLQDMGFEAAHLKESFSTWEKQGGPVEFPEKKP